MSETAKCKHESMWFSRTIHPDGYMHCFCDHCGMQDDMIDAEAKPPSAPPSTPAAPRQMHLPKHPDFPNYSDTHPEDEWCARVGCTPACSSSKSVEKHDAPPAAVPQGEPPAPNAELQTVLAKFCPQCSDYWSDYPGLGAYSSCTHRRPVAGQGEPSAREPWPKIWSVQGIGGSNAAFFNRESAERFVADRKEPHRFRIIEYIPEWRLRQMEQALRYVLEVREIKCVHKHPGPDEACAKCRADVALEEAK